MDLDNDVKLDDLLATYDVNCSQSEVKFPFVGLWNLGNTCFFNSIVQMLYYCPGFRTTLLAEEGKVKQLLEGDGIDKVLNEKNTGCVQSAEEARNKCNVFIELCQLFNSMSSNQKSFLDDKLQEKCAVRPEGLMDVLRKAYPVFAPFTQQDAQECLRCILSILQDAISLALRKGLTHGEIPTRGLDGEKKLFGGRKLDGNGGGASTSAEESQRENRDPNKMKQESRSTILRKKKAKSLLKNPLKSKISDNHHPLHALNNGRTPKRGNGALGVEYENLNDSTNESGCFAKLNKKFERKHGLPGKTSNYSPTTSKRTSEDEPITPPPKRRRLNLGTGIKNLYKPIVPNFLKSKTAGLSEKYTLQKSSSCGKSNPFKVATKFDSSPKYRLLDLDNKETNGAGDVKNRIDKTAQQPLTSNSSQSDLKSNNVDTVDADDRSEKQEIIVETDKSPNTLSDFVENLFQGQLVNDIRCMECENSLQRTENFMDISLPVKEENNKKDENGQDARHDSEHCSVLWGLSEFMSKEILDGENKYYCAHCNRYVEGERKLQFSHIPPILTLHLKRFTSSKPAAGGDAFCSTVSKINSSLQVPFELCMTEWCTETCKEKTSQYKLFGIVIHSGVTISSGHYLSYIHLNKSTGLAKEDKTSSDIDSRLVDYDGCWLEADDDITKVISQDDFRQLLSPSGGTSRTPYLLFYQRQDE